MNLKAFFAWLGRRLKEPSTYVGLATAAAAVGLLQVGAAIGTTGQVITLVLGTGVAAASTSQP